jgi:hypothetical protein
VSLTPSPDVQTPAASTTLSPHHSCGHRDAGTVC